MKNHHRRLSSHAYKRRASGTALMSDYRLLELALEAATSATSHDNGLKYQRAGAGYSKAIKYLSLVMQRHASVTSTAPTTTTTRGITLQQIEQIKHYHLVYQQRLAGLDSAKPSANSKNMSHTSPHREARVRRTSLSKIPFVEDVVHKQHCPRPPAAIWRRPYWLLKRLQRWICSTVHLCHWINLESKGRQNQWVAT